jgi:endonuclease I
MFKVNNIKLLLAIFVAFNFAKAQPIDYYSSIDFSKNGNALKVQLSQLISNTHTTDIVYTSSRTDTWDVLRISDLQSQNSSNVLLMYGFNDYDGSFINDRTRDVIETCHLGSCVGKWNREHVYAKSLAKPSLVTNKRGSGTDVHNLRAIDSQKNSQRNNRLFADSSGNSKIIGNYFYPGDEWKGDVARIIMYMYLRYPTQCEAVNLANGSTSYSSKNDMPNLFLEWNQDDPVSILELKRNNVIYSYQGNRNPFIDNPYLATLIWNGPIANDTWGVVPKKEVVSISISISSTITKRIIEINGLLNDDFKVLIYNQLNQKIIYSSEIKTIDISSFPSGFYVIKVEGITGIFESKFIIR